MRIRVWALGLVAVAYSVASAPGQFLMIPESTNRRIMTFSPTDGSLINLNYVPADTVNLSTPIHAVPAPGGNGILVSDQLLDRVQQFSTSGTFTGTFAPVGGVNNALLDNIRGMEYRPNGNLLVTVGGSGNNNSIAEFTSTGAYVGQFIATGSGGLASPFGIEYRPAQNDYLVSSSSSGVIRRYDANGASLGDFATSASSFGQQIAIKQNGNVLVSFFTPSNGQDLFEYTSTGSFVRSLDVAGQSGFRGVYELANGNLLATNGSGVYVVDPVNGAILNTVVTGVSARYIELMPVPEPAGMLTVVAGAALAMFRRARRTQIVAGPETA